MVTNWLNFLENSINEEIKSYASEYVKERKRRIPAAYLRAQVKKVMDAAMIDDVMNDDDAENNDAFEDDWIREFVYEKSTIQVDYPID